MKREEFISRVAERWNGPKTTVESLLISIEEEVFYAMSQEEEVPFKFGKIGGKTVPAREGKNPLTGETIKIPEKRGYPYFKASARAKGKSKA